MDKARLPFWGYTDLKLYKKPLYYQPKSITQQGHSLPKLEIMKRRYPVLENCQGMLPLMPPEKWEHRCGRRESPRTGKLPISSSVCRVCFRVGSCGEYCDAVLWSRGAGACVMKESYRQAYEREHGARMGEGTGDLYSPDSCWTPGWSCVLNNCA